MKTITEYTEEMTIEEFADKHDLTMVIRERRVGKGDPMRYYASFDRSETKDGCALVGTYGNGKTPEGAVMDYTGKLECKMLVIDAMRDSRREILCPRFSFTHPNN